MAPAESVKRRNAGGGGGSLSVLPAELLWEVVARLPLVDRCRLRAACRWWRDSFPDTTRSDHEAARLLFRKDGDGDKALWLMVPSRWWGNCHTFYDACSPTRRFRAAHLPPLRFIVGSSPGGWVLHVDGFGDLHALNVLTGEHLRPPPLTAFRGLTRVDCDARAFEDCKPCEKYVPYKPYIVHSYFHALIFFPEANSSTGVRGRFLVVVIHGPCQEIAYAWEGDEHWTDGWPRLRDIFFSCLLPRRGRIYAAKENGTVVSFDPCHPTDPGFRACTAMFWGRSGSREKLETGAQYLVEISSELWLVSRRTKYSKEKGRRGILSTVGVELHRLVEGAGVWVWVEVKKLDDDVALFLGVNQALALSTRDYPQLEPGCIYFTDNNWDHHFLDKVHPICNVGVFDTKKKTFKRGYHWSRGDCPWPAWILL